MVSIVKRMDELANEYRLDWLPKAFPFPDSVRWYRGFVDALLLDATNNVDDENLHCINGLPLLTTLELQNCELITSTGFSIPVNLNSLRLAGTKVTDQALAKIVGNNPALKLIFRGVMD